jgi:hypothetical protein
MRAGVIAELPGELALFRAVRAIRARGWSRLEAYTPYYIEGLDEAMGRHRSPLAIATAGGALFGAIGAYALQWFLVAYLYPIDAGDRPPHMPLAYVPITIEMGFLFGGIVSFLAVLVAARLVKLWEPVNDVPGFVSATRDGFWLAIGRDDPQFDALAIESELAAAGAMRVSWFGGEV